jgi:RNA polymerase-binding transcription factor DksA
MMTFQQTTYASQLSQDALGRLRRALVDDSATQTAQFAAHQAMVSQLRGATDGDSVLERELAEAGAARARDAIQDIERALQRLDAGTYGSCQGCGSQIAIERLEAIPSARFCVACRGRRAGWPR